MAVVYELDLRRVQPVDRVLVLVAVAWADHPVQGRAHLAVAVDLAALLFFPIPT